MSSLFLSRIDYCNALLVGCPNYTIDRLQRVQNKAARITSLTRPHDHITPVLKSLHWLPVKERIDFKILCQSFKAFNRISPSYLQELLTPHKPGRNLRSADQILLQEKMFSSFSYKSFSFSAPFLWNNISLAARSSLTYDDFRASLKTELFKKAFCIL